MNVSIILRIKFFTTSIVNEDTYNPMKVATYDADMNSVITTLYKVSLQVVWEITRVIILYPFKAID